MMVMKLFLPTGKLGIILLGIILLGIILIQSFLDVPFCIQEVIGMSDFM